MEDILLVQKFEREQDLSDYLNCLIFSEAFDALKSLMQVLGTILERLLYDIKTLPILENVVHSRNVWMMSVNKHFEVVNKQVSRDATLAEHFLFKEFER